MFAVGRKCEGFCGPHNRPHSSVSLLFHSLPFIVTFTVVSLLVLHRLFPVLCTQRNRHPYPYNGSSESRHRKRIAALAFSTTLGATGVLAELILCEVSDWVDSEARRVAFRVTVSVLLLCLIVVIPVIEIVTVVEATKVGTWRWRNQMMVIGGVFAAWLWVFWNVGDVLPMRKQEFSLWQSSRTLSEECLARVGVVGVSLMALLSGFGCVSTPFSAKPRHISETDITRAQSGLEAAHDMLELKRNQLRILEKRIHDKQTSHDGLMSKMISTIRSSLDSDSQEKTTLLHEISGLETMAADLSARLNELQNIQRLQSIARTPRGRITSFLYFIFSIYCLYRIAATTFAHMPFLHRRSASSSYSQTDPITNVLALLGKHWDPHLDRAAWSRQIGFLLSGVIIAGSLTSVISTLSMLSRAAPGVVVRAMKAESSPGFALMVSQLSAVYVLAAALLLRSNLPPYMSSVITESLGAPLDTQFVEKWFDGLFLGAAAVTAVGMVVVRKWKKIGEEEEWEMAGKEC